MANMDYLPAVKRDADSLKSRNCLHLLASSKAPSCIPLEIMKQSWLQPIVPSLEISHERYN